MRAQHLVLSVRIAGHVDSQKQVWLHPNDFPPLLPPIGEAYVVIYSRDHDRTFTKLNVDEVYAVTHLWRELHEVIAKVVDNGRLLLQESEKSE